MPSAWHPPRAKRPGCLKACWLRKSWEDWSRMSAAVSHEINNPLESVQNLLYLIECADGLSAEARGLATQAAAEVERVRGDHALNAGVLSRKCSSGAG